MWLDNPREGDDLQPTGQRHSGGTLKAVGDVCEGQALGGRAKAWEAEVLWHDVANASQHGHLMALHVKSFEMNIFVFMNCTK